MVGLLVGCVCLVLGALGVSGRMATSRLRLYSGMGAATPDKHARAQRFGGGSLLVGGVVFVAAALYRLLTQTLRLVAGELVTTRSE